MKPSRPRRGGAVLVLAAVLGLAGCPDGGGNGRAAGAQRFEADIRPIGESGVSGRAAIRLDDGTFSVEVVAGGLEPGTRISQHLNTWWDCTTLGRVLVNLDADLTVPGEGPPRGDDYPLVNDAGQLSYTASRAVPELTEALHNYRGMLYEELDVENRTIFLRDDGYRPIACGELRVAD